MLKPIDIFIIVLAVLAVVGVIARQIWKKKTGRVDCGCGCNGCKNKNCPSAKPKDENA